MAKRGPSFGMVMLLIVMAVVLVLVAKAWKAVAPAALDTHDALNSGPLNDHGQTEAASALREGELPGLTEVQAETDAHSARVQEALEAVD